MGVNFNATASFGILNPKIQEAVDALDEASEADGGDIYEDAIVFVDEKAVGPYAGLELLEIDYGSGVHLLIDYSAKTGASVDLGWDPVKELDISVDTEPERAKLEAFCKEYGIEYDAPRWYLVGWIS